MSRSHQCKYRRGAPKWDVNFYNRRFRRQVKAAIHHRDPTVRPENAQWHYW